MKIDISKYPMIKSWEGYKDKNTHLPSTCQGCSGDIVKTIATIDRSGGLCYCRGCSNRFNARKKIKEIDRSSYPMVADWSNYVNTTTKLKCVCQNCGVDVLKTLKYLDNSKSCLCVKCSYVGRGSVDINWDDYPMVVDNSGYVNTRSKLLCKCQECDTIIEKTINNLKKLISNGLGCLCVECSAVRSGEKRGRIINRDDYPMVKSWDGYKNIHSFLLCECQNCSCDIHKNIKSIDYHKNCLCANCQRDIAKNTMMELYGYDNPFKSKEVQETIVNDRFEKYGFKYPMQRDEIKNRRVENNIKRYGVVNPSKLDHVKERVKRTKYERHGDVNYNNAEKKIKTVQEKYGVDNVFQLQFVKDKAQKTTQEKYGVPWFCMHEDYYNARGNRISKINQWWKRSVEKLGYGVETEHIINNLSYDLRLENTNIVMEVNPTYTHNSTIAPFFKNAQPKAKNYHSEKTTNATNNGYRLIHVWDWDDSNQILKLLSPLPKLYARKCDVRELSYFEANRFIDNNHMQGSLNLKNQICIGLYHNSELVSVMTFGKPRYNKNYEYELLRYCSSHSVTGGSQKIFNYFIKRYNPQSIISYCDMSKFDGKTYLKLGFTQLRFSISRHWYNAKTKQHISDNSLRQKGFDNLVGEKIGQDHCYGRGSDNNELMVRYGFVEIYDGGQTTYTWRREEMI